MKRSDLQKIEGEVRMTRASTYSGAKRVRIVDATKRWELGRSGHWARISVPREAASYSKATGVLVEVLRERARAEPEWERTVLQPSQITDETPEAYEIRRSEEIAELQEWQARQAAERQETIDTIEDLRPRLEAALRRPYPLSHYAPGVTLSWDDLDHLLTLAEV